MSLLEYLTLLLEVTVALVVLGWAVAFAVASVVGSFHQARHCDRCQNLTVEIEDVKESDEGHPVTGSLYRSN
jgi:hypothetical protein